MNEPLTDTARPRRTSGRARRNDGGGVVLPTQYGETVALNATARALWELCDGTTSVEEMVDAVSVLFGLERDRARGDVQAALNLMRDAGVVG